MKLCKNGIKVRQAGNLCENAAISDEMCRDKFVFGLHNETLRTELLRTHDLSQDSGAELVIVWEYNQQYLLFCACDILDKPGVKTRIR